MNTPILATRQLPPAPNFNQQLLGFMREAILRSEQEFTCQGTPMSVEMLTQENGFLPLWVFAASEKLERLWGPQSIIFHAQEEGTLLQVLLGQQRATLPSSLWFHALHLVLEEAIVAAYEEDFSSRRRHHMQLSNMTGRPVSLDKIVDRWDLALSERTVSLSPTPATSVMRGR